MGTEVGAFLPEREEYRFSITNGRERHDWIVIGKLGAVNVWAEPCAASAIFREPWIGGVECHYAQQPNYGCGHHERCWLLDAECWHDGSSLQFSEQVAPYLSAPTGKQMGADAAFHPMLVARNRFRVWLTEPAHEVEDAPHTIGPEEGTTRHD